MAQSWTEIMKKADGNSRSAAHKLKEQALAAARLKAAKQMQKKQVKQTISNSNNTQKNIPPKKEPVTTDKPKEKPKPVLQSVKKAQPPPLSFQDLIRAAEFNSSGKPIPKDIVHRIESQKVKTSAPTPSSSTVTSKTKNESVKMNGTKPMTNSSQIDKSKITKQRASSLPAKNSMKNQPVTNGNKTKPVLTSATSNSVKKPVPIKPTSSNVKIDSKKVKPVVSNNKPTVSVSTTSNGTRPSLSNGTKPMVNGNQNRISLPVNKFTNVRRPVPFVQPKKRPIIDTDDEDDEELRDFIVDDDDNANEYDYKKELEETLKQNFRFDAKKYQGRFLDDDDDLDNMESSFDQIEREEEYSRRMGLKEDIDDIVREEHEKRKRLNQAKKRAKTS